MAKTATKKTAPRKANPAKGAKGKGKATPSSSSKPLGGGLVVRPRKGTVVARSLAVLAKAKAPMSASAVREAIGLSHGCGPTLAREVAQGRLAAKPDGLVITADGRKWLAALGK